MVTVRHARLADLPRITDIYNYYVLHTAITFDYAPFDWKDRVEWFQQFNDHGPHQLFVAEVDGQVVAYAGSMLFRAKPAYRPTVELTLYVAHEHRSRGIGRRLYETLFEAIRKAGVVMLVAVIATPNRESEEFHKRLGFEHAGVLPAVGCKFGVFWDTSYLVRSLVPREALVRPADVTALQPCSLSSSSSSNHRTVAVDAPPAALSVALARL